MSYFIPGQTDIEKSQAYIYAIGIVACVITPLFTYHPYRFLTLQLEMKMKIGLSGLMYRKALKLDKSTIASGVTGQLINLMTNDVTKFEFISWGHDIWKGPFETIVCGYFIYREVGAAALVGLGFILSFMPVQSE